ncbi:HNH endonuclease [Pinisolibacter sp.]|uniref:HNH endonuclease n=1 Tax=Pinisolibacter sp. TaxID=2172024 RepID=UPI002FDCAF76
MPIAAPRVCGLCGGVHASGIRCSKAIARDKERKARHDEQRPSARERGYDGKWQQARAAFLAKHPKCAKCGEPATVVDHVIPHRGDKRLFWQRSNWQPLCVSCHSSRKQSEERRR